MQDAEVNVCPDCGSTNVRVIREKFEPPLGRPFVLEVGAECLDCGNMQAPDQP